MNASVRVQHQDFDLNHEHQLLKAGDGQCGAVVMFCGLVRDYLPPQQLLDLTLEYYPSMTEKALHELVTQAHERWELLRVTIVHRVGKLLPGEQIVFVGVSSAHRTNAFEAAQFLMDQLKTRAPFWKKESLRLDPQQPAQSHWVAAKDSDEQLAQRW
jgi:molybdopterin synthase catalytic subunit